ncbi:hypothetical protein E1265_26715 [Streptomyces sp. 8K308]|nr:hypothetical protein E1265_26715 [Streptomyces sp. 8K308]
MTAAPAEKAEPAIAFPVPSLGGLTKWQRDGWLCVWCAGLLLLVPRLRLARVRDAEGRLFDLFVCEPCVLATVEKALADGS